MSIPYTLHTVRWARLPATALQVQCERSWLKHLLVPVGGIQWRCQHWDEDAFLLKTPETQTTAKMPLPGRYIDWINRARPANVTNLLRMFAVYTQGGIYLDNDVEVLKPLHPIADAHRAFFGFQQDTSEGDTINNAIFGAGAGNPLLMEIMERIVATDPRGCAARSGPGIVSKLLCPKGLPLHEHDVSICGTTVHLFPKEVLYPFRWNQIPERKYLTERTMTIHWWEGSWLPKNQHFPEAIGRFVEDEQ